MEGPFFQPPARPSIPWPAPLPPPSSAAPSAACGRGGPDQKNHGKFHQFIFSPLNEYVHPEKLLVYPNFDLYFNIYIYTYIYINIYIYIIFIIYTYIYIYIWVELIGFGFMAVAQTCGSYACGSVRESA